MLLAHIQDTEKQAEKKISEARKKAHDLVVQAEAKAQEAKAQKIETAKQAAQAKLDAAKGEISATYTKTLKKHTDKVASLEASFSSLKKSVIEKGVKLVMKQSV